ncbi:MAG TPA: hypothetical protein H9948_11505 [Candidatus Jeotgalibaca merdavium]|uniref:DUF2238 domain-containing protein n=1 Tax=Candidatus Jeotgalibaca merdavium TaxID=2838627 RepID=A0A9D2I3X5_9LACT|nr:hypothetical protein [Jeotgalibaca arthritidis]HJA91404.1 hypothetical protein [Candidatus Jeotgalibaca merdavium]
MEESQKLEKRKNLVFIIVLALLVVSIFYATYMLFQSSGGIAEQEGERVKTDYILMILQCLVGAIVIFIPKEVEQRFKVHIPNMIEITYFIFLFCAIYLGEVRNFYYRVPYWDVILHFFSAAMLGAIGFILVDYLAAANPLKLKLSPFFVSFFAYCFAITCGVVWEIYEFLADGLLQTNMQKFITAQGEVLIGRAALVDTMKDIIVDAVGALIIVVLGYYSLKRKQDKKC